MASICLPADVPKPSKDSVDLHRAFESSNFGCDGNSVLRILAHRDACQRFQIKTAYKNMYGEDLSARLKKELRSHFQKAMLMWMQDPLERDAMILKNALTPKFFSVACRNQIVAEVLSTKSVQELDLIARAYDCLYNRRLQDDIESTMSGPCQKIFSGYFDGIRDDDAWVDMDEALKEADRLHTAVSSQQIDETTLIRILIARNHRQLCSIFDAYKKTYGHSVYEVLKQRDGNGGSELVRTVSIITQCLDNVGDYYAQVLYKCMKGWGTDDNTLIRVIVTSAEVSMEDIKTAFYQKYGKALSSMVSLDTTGNYRKFLMALIGAPD